MPISVRIAVIISVFMQGEESKMLADEGTFEEWDKVMPISNPLSYKG